MAKHPFSKRKIEFKFFILKSRIFALRKDILILATISLLSILLIELWFVDIPAPNKYFHFLGGVYLKLCYSFFSAFIFYFLVVHLPKENRKFKSYRQISNKVHKINQYIYSLLDALLKGIDPAHTDEIKAEVIKEACEKTNPIQGVIALDFSSLPYGKAEYNNWYELLQVTSVNIRDEIKDLLLLNDSIDANLLEAATHLDDTAKWFNYKKGTPYNSLSFISYPLINLRNEAVALRKVVSKSYKYSIEYHTLARKRNLVLIQQNKL